MELTPEKITGIVNKKESSIFLTPRERDMIIMHLDGISASDIGNVFDIGSGQVRNKIKLIYHKLSLYSVHFDKRILYMYQKTVSEILGEKPNIASDISQQKIIDFLEEYGGSERLINTVRREQSNTTLGNIWLKLLDLKMTHPRSNYFGVQPYLEKYYLWLLQEKITPHINDIGTLDTWMIPFSVFEKKYFQYLYLYAFFSFRDIVYFHKNFEKYMGNDHKKFKEKIEKYLKYFNY